ncbi:hypothetical protein [Ruminococcus flavefaciens]|uniref:hypothetical protein n=1 Tax=Ruminococcus flavefaciens TaxID=1265 RepID=UPI003F064FED
MRGRKIPYGYKMSNGRYVLEEKEAEVVKIVFSLTEANKKPSEIHKIVCEMDTDYFSGDIDKSIIRVSTMLQKEYYCGSGDYPAIITKECYDNARKNMSNRSHYYAEGKTKIPLKQTCCAICGGQLFRNRDLDDRIWKCSTVGCANRTNGIKEDEFYSQVLSILMDVQADCSLLDKEAVLTEYKPIMNVRMGENEVVMRCHIKPIDDERIKKEIIKLAALKYDCCTYDRTKYLTEEIKDRLRKCEPIFDIDSLLIKDIVKKVILIDHKHISIEFKNGKTITYGG